MNDIPQPLTPAFPNNGVTGMSLRDYFAAKAMQAIISSQFGRDFSLSEICEEAYAYADVMLRKRGEESAEQ